MSRRCVCFISATTFLHFSPLAQVNFSVPCDTGPYAMMSSIITNVANTTPGMESGHCRLANNELALQATCHLGHLDAVLELLALGGDREVDVHAGDEEAF